MDTQPPSCSFVVSVSGLGDVAFRVGSHVLGHLIGLGGVPFPFVNVGLLIDLLFCWPFL